MTSFQKGDTLALQDQLVGALIGLARATEGNEYLLTPSTAAVTVEGLSAAAIEEPLDNGALLALLDRADAEKRKLVPSCYQCAAPCGRTDNYDMQKLQTADPEIRRLKMQILSVSREIARKVCRAAELGCKEDSIHNFLYKALFSIGMEDWSAEELLPILQEAEEISRRCAANEM